MQAADLQAHKPAEQSVAHDRVVLTTSKDCESIEGLLCLGLSQTAHEHHACCRLWSYLMEPAA